MKKIIRLTEGDLHSIVKESVKRILREGGSWEQNGEIDITDRVYDMVSEEVGDDGQLEELFYKMEHDDVFIIEFTIDTMDQTPGILYMTDTDTVMEGVKKYINDQELLSHIKDAVDIAINSISDSELHDNVPCYGYDYYDFYADKSNFLPRSV